ncbi:unnamed protein product [Effrenium voratum]|nr:unnamed protein product [Effrenium voratum]
MTVGVGRLGCRCTPVKLVGVDSFQTGKLPRYRWELANGTQEDPNPKDLTNNPLRIIDAAKVQLVREALQFATDFNMGTLEMPSDYLEAATTYKMLFSVGSRWGLTTSKEVLLTKLNFPAPMVSINGPAEISRRRPDRITLEAVGIPSECANASQNLGYRWAWGQGPISITATDMVNVNDYNIYNFTVECFVNTVQGDVPERMAYARVTVKIYRSTVYVVYRTASRMVTKGDILVLDVRGSQDPDYPTLEGQTFRGTFNWRCYTPPPERGACFGGSATGLLEDMITCRQEGVKSEADRTYSWTVLAYYPNPDYDPDLAQERLNDPTNPYTVDQFKYVDQSARFDTRDQRLFRTDPLLPNIIIQPNVLQPSTKYKLRLNIHLTFATPAARRMSGRSLQATDGVTQVTGFADIVIETAGLPPRSGRLEVVPGNRSMDTPRTLSAPDWVATDLPLTYSFGYIKFVDGNPLDAAFNTDPQQVSSKELSRLAMGPPSNNHTLYLFVEVFTPYGAKSRAEVAIQSLPVENLTQASLDGLEAAQNSDASNLVNNLDYVLSLDPTDPATQNAVLDLIAQNSDELPTTPSQLQSQALLFSDLVSNGQDSDTLLDELERLVQVSANQGAISLDGELAGVYFDIFGNLYPGDDPSFLAGRRLADEKRAATGPSATMSKYRSSSSFYAEEKGLPGKRRSNLHFLHGATRLPENHPSLEPNQYILRTCDTGFCDRVGLACSPEDFKPVTWFTCCDARNTDTLCNEPPCWFHGNGCPVPQTAPGLTGRRLDKPGLGKDEGWFDSWKHRHKPLSSVDESEASEYDREQAYQGWHPSSHERRLIFARGNLSQSLGDRLLAMEADELPMLLEAQRLTKEAALLGQDDYIADAAEIVAFQSMTPAIAAKLEADKRAQDDAMHQFVWQRARNASQRITRLNVMRDTVSKSLLVQMQTTLDPLTFTSKAYTITIGKTTNLSSVHPAFIFPSAFQVPPDSRDTPTATNPFTRFAYLYVEYLKNIYDWSDSNPLSTENQLITLHVLKGSTLELDESSSPEWIRIFADTSLFSNVVCLFWDRFAAGTAGGRWSSTGVVNDDTGCITSHLTDFGIFMDGRVPDGYGLVEAATHWEREVWVSNCVGCGDESNLTVVAVLGMLLFALILLILLTYTLDESQRTLLAQNKVKSRYYYDGNGINSPMSIDDPVAYQYGDGPLFMLWLGTLWNVAKRDHALVSTIFYHETFTRPQRLQCFIALLTGLLAVNAAVHSHPGSIQEAQEFVITGMLSGLLIFPIFCGLVMMFNLRPAQVKKRLIKRAYSTKEIDKLSEQRQRLANQSTMLPPPGYMANPPPVSGTPANTLLSLRGSLGSSLKLRRRRFLVPAENGPMPLFIRGQPPPQLPTPFQGGPPPGPPPRGFQVPAPGGIPMVPPAPPPPPREDDQAFVRRIRMTYMDKVTKDHDKHDLLEDLEELGKETPGWVYDTMTIMPYLASSTFTLASIFIVLQYGMKFQTFQEEMWWKGSLIGLGLVLGVLDIVRVVMMTLVELRKFENRRKAKDGQFLPRRIRRENEKDYQPAPPPRLWKQAVAAPPVPKGPAITTAPPRPAFLPPPPQQPALPGPG